MEDPAISLYKKIKHFVWNRAHFKKFIHYALTVLTLAYIVSGVGMVHKEIITKYTLGLLDSHTCYLIHSNMLTAFLILLVLHIYFTLSFKRREQLKNLWHKVFTMRP